MASDDGGSGTLVGRVAVVTGGASGIGAATATLLAAQGASVVVADRNGPGAEQHASSLAGDALGVACDVRDEAQVEALIAAAIARFGRIDVLVNAAGVSGTFSSLADLPTAAFDATLAINLRGTFLCLRGALPHLVAAGGHAAVVNVSSGAGVRGFAMLADYVTSKHAVIGLTRSAALEYARQGVRINAVCPGSVRTPMLAAFAGSDEALDKMGRMAPMGRLGTPEEIAEAILWLCSDAAAFVTGAVLEADGGVAAA